MPFSEAVPRWVEALKRVAAGEREGILCAQNGDDFLVVEWIPFKRPGAAGGEWWLHCPACGAETFGLTYEDPNASDDY
jgi:hypothetical protein